jgi:hypothetical protein
VSANAYGATAREIAAEFADGAAPRVELSKAYSGSSRLPATNRRQRRRRQRARVHRRQRRRQPPRGHPRPFGLLARETLEVQRQLPAVADARSEGNYQAYIEDLKRRKGPDTDQPHRTAYKKLVRARSASVSHPRWHPFGLATS